MRIVDTNGRPYFTTLTLKIDPRLSIESLIVYGEFFALISRNTVINYPETVVNIFKYTGTSKVAFIKEFRWTG